MISSDSYLFFIVFISIKLQFLILSDLKVFQKVLFNKIFLSKNIPILSSTKFKSSKATKTRIPN